VTRTRPALRSALCALVATALAVTLSGCLKTDINLTLHDDTVDGSIVIAIDRKVIDLSGTSEDGWYEDLKKRAVNPDAPGVHAEKYADATYAGVRYTFTKASLAVFADTTSGNSLRFVHDTAAKQYKVSGTFNFTVAEGPNAADAAKVQAHNFDVKISITFPGTVLRHNGELTGTTVTWHPKPNEKTTLEAVADDSASSSSATSKAVVGGTAAAIAVLVLLLLWMLVRRRGAVARSAAATNAAPAEPGEAPDAEAPAPDQPPAPE